MSKKIPLKEFLKAMDNYLEGQENHIIKRSEEKMITIRTVVHWAKWNAENLAK